MHCAGSAPDSLRRAGCTSRRVVTAQLTGFPGRAKNRTSFPLSPLGTVAKVVGFPGFILMRPKCTFPIFCSRGLIRSESPIDTPPVVITASQVLAALRRASSRALPWSLTIPRSTGSAPSWVRRASRVYLFASKILAPPSSAAPAAIGSTSSSPLLITPTFGLENTKTLATPRAAKSPTSVEVKMSPFCMTTWPSATSLPTLRTFLPATTPLHICTAVSSAGTNPFVRSPPGMVPSERSGDLVSSTFITASAPFGSLAPVVM
mmetsp:Transcript_2124/g.3116  ORF Transcript_2124/g.3116 Transcript_2124/m.3116 type:complete len:262 (-) Transcript_2124:391-1176(-)